MEKTKTNKREWVKTVLIIFLVIMLILTFFSNTIMNRSLPEVATQTVYSGAINAKIRGSGTIAANESYDVTLSQTRKVKSVMVRTGDEVQVGDLLLTLEPMDSAELQQAKEMLADMELAYQKRLIEESNASSREDRQTQKLRDAYNEAQQNYQRYSNVDPDQIEAEKSNAELILNNLERDLKDVNNELQDVRDALSDYQSDISELEQEAAAADSIIFEAQNKIAQISDTVATLDRDRYIHENDYNALLDYATACGDGYAEGNIAVRMAAFAEDYLLLTSMSGIDELYAQQMGDAYDTLIADVDAVLRQTDYLMPVATDQIFSEIYRFVISIANAEIAELEASIRTAGAAESRLDDAYRVISQFEYSIKVQEDHADNYAEVIEDQQDLINDLSSATGAAATLKAAEEALEDRLFELSLSDSASLDVQKEKEAIEKQKELIEILSAEADGQDIYSTVSGVVEKIHTSAGNTVGAETPVLSITIADRGYTMQIPVTVEQARKVNIGDTAEITNYWYGNITATLENIINDPQNMNGGKILMFRLTGDEIQPGTNLTLSIGQRSANYDALVPNSAIRTDSNGKFVLVIVAKSSPLGNRYIATRADVQVLASDDTMSAVSGLAYGDFVITTSTVPIEAGNQVRLVDNG